MNNFLTALFLSLGSKLSNNEAYYFKQLKIKRKINDRMTKKYECDLYYNNGLI